MAMGLKRFALSEANHAHGHVVVAARSAAEQLFPLRLASQGHLVGGPGSPFKIVEVYRGYLHGEATFNLG